MFFQKNGLCPLTGKVTPHRVYLDVPLRYPAKLRDKPGICTIRTVM